MPTLNKDEMIHCVIVSMSLLKNAHSIFLSFLLLQITSSEDSVFEKHADKIAQILQRMAEDDVIFELRRSTVTSLSKRNVHELPGNSKRSSKRSLKILENFEKLFRRKLRDPSSGIIAFNFCLKLCFMYCLLV